MKTKKPKTLPCVRCGGCCEVAPCLFPGRLARALEKEGYRGPLARKASSGEWYVPRAGACPHYEKTDGGTSCALFEFESWKRYWRSQYCGWPVKRKPERSGRGR